MPNATTAINRIRADLYTVEAELRRLAEQMAAKDDLLSRLRQYLGDGHAGAPLAAAFVAEIDQLIGEQ